MEKVLLISLLLIGVISSCSNNEDNIPVDDYLTTNEWKLLAQDSTHIYYASINNESKKRLVKERRSDNDAMSTPFRLSVCMIISLPSSAPLLLLPPNPKFPLPKMAAITINAMMS